jgi:hypothetical protein
VRAAQDALKVQGRADRYRGSCALLYLRPVGSGPTVHHMGTPRPRPRHSTISPDSLRFPARVMRCQLFQHTKLSPRHRGTDSGDNIPNGWRKSSWMHRRVRCLRHGGHVVWVKSWNERFHESHTAPFGSHAVSPGSSSVTFLGLEASRVRALPKVVLSRPLIDSCDSSCTMATFTRIPEEETPSITVHPDHKISKINDNIYGGFTE